MTTSTPEPSADATTYDGITERIDWLVSNILGIDAQLTERGRAADAGWRARAINAKNYRLAELRSQKLRRRQLAAPDDRSRELLDRALQFIDGMEEMDDIQWIERDALAEAIKECLG